MRDYLFGASMVAVPVIVVYGLDFLSTVIGNVAWALPFVIWGIFIWHSHKTSD